MAILDNPDNVMGVSHKDNHLQLSSLLPQSKVQRLCPYMVITVMPTPLLLCPPSASALRLGSKAIPTSSLWSLAVCNMEGEGLGYLSLCAVMSGRQMVCTLGAV